MASELEPVAVIGPLKATRMLLDGSAVLVRREEWERLTALLAERDAEIARLTRDTITSEQRGAGGAR